MPPSLQTHINFDWNNSVHERERTIPGQQYLDRNRRRFGGQNKQVYDFLIVPGNIADDNIARAWKPEVRHLHSRISDLVNVLGFKISRRYDKEKNLMVYWMSAEDRIYNQQILNTLNLQPQR